MNTIINKRINNSKIKITKNNFKLIENMRKINNKNIKKTLWFKKKDNNILRIKINREVEIKIIIKNNFNKVKMKIINQSL